jgi:hypothetical protein
VQIRLHNYTLYFLLSKPGSNTYENTDSLYSSFLSFEQNSVVDPNPKKSLDFDTDSDPDTVVKWQILWKAADQTLEREKRMFFLLENSFLCNTGSKTHMKITRGTILKNFK